MNLQLQCIYSFKPKGRLSGDCSVLLFTQLYCHIIKCFHISEDVGTV